MTNKFFALFSGIGNRVLNLFDANHYQIIDEERYRTEDQFYSNKKEEKTESTQDEQPATQNLNDLDSQNQTTNDATSD